MGRVGNISTLQHNVFLKLLSLLQHTESWYLYLIYNMILFTAVLEHLRTTWYILLAATDYVVLTILLGCKCMLYIFIQCVYCCQMTIKPGNVILWIFCLCVCFLLEQQWFVITYFFNFFVVENSDLSGNDFKTLPDNFLLGVPNLKQL